MNNKVNVSIKTVHPANFLSQTTGCCKRNLHVGCIHHSLTEPQAVGEHYSIPKRMRLRYVTQSTLFEVSSIIQYCGCLCLSLYSSSSLCTRPLNNPETKTETTAVQTSSVMTFTRFDLRDCLNVQQIKRNENFCTAEMSATR